jgi:glyoxylase-like metal-dependent hydrolase (beta-lactamase superfamily II)
MSRMSHMRSIVAFLLFAIGCGRYAPARGPVPPALTRNLQLESLETAVRWPAPSVPVVMQLAAQYLAVHREEQGYHYFLERAAAVPDRPLFLALTGLFQARIANRVPLLKRIAWIDEVTHRLDEAAARDGLSRYLRGLVYAELPASFGKAQVAEADLRWMLAHADNFPEGLKRGAEAGLGRLHGEPAGETLLTDFALTAAGGLRMTTPKVVEPAPGVLVARGYDFADIAFVITRDSVVAIDAGTTEATARAAVDALRQRTQLPIKHVVITHAHWDHVGGLRALVEPGTQVIASARFAGELQRTNTVPVNFQYFFGAAGSHGPWVLAPDHLVQQPETLTVGGVRLQLLPTAGGETDDALLAFVPDRGVLFVGDAFMPYFGAPFVAEGSVDGMLQTIAQIEELRPTVLIHGHAPLTDNFTLAVLPSLGEALRKVEGDTLAQLRAGKDLTALLERNQMPDSLAAHPDAVLPFLLMRENLVKRLYAQHTGYWKSDGEGVDVVSRHDWGEALELMGGESKIAEVARELDDRGDFALALQLTDAGLAAHPGSKSLEAARARALDGLRAKYQANPFKLTVYSEMAGKELAPPK